MTTTRYSLIETPIGALVANGDGGALSGLNFGDGPPDPTWVRDDRAFREAAAQLRAYFAGALTHFTVPLSIRGTPFQQSVWAELASIPYGATTTYAQLAAKLGKPAAVRAVGHANGRNPISIIIPCHRVLGTGGGLTGYGGGLNRKQWLLQHERGEAPKW